MLFALALVTDYFEKKPCLSPPTQFILLINESQRKPYMITLHNGMHVLLSVVANPKGQYICFLDIHVCSYVGFAQGKLWQCTVY